MRFFLKFEMSKLRVISYHLFQSCNSITLIPLDKCFTSYLTPCISVYSKSPDAPRDSSNLCSRHLTKRVDPCDLTTDSSHPAIGVSHLKCIILTTDLTNHLAHPLVHLTTNCYTLPYLIITRAPPPSFSPVCSPLQIIKYVAITFVGHCLSAEIAPRNRG